MSNPIQPPLVCNICGFIQCNCLLREDVPLSQAPNNSPYLNDYNPDLDWLDFCDEEGNYEG